MTPSTTIQVALGAAVLVVGVLASVVGRQLHASEPTTEVVVECRDGLLRRGQVDARSDEHQLWLHQRSNSVALSFALDWKHIVRGKVNGKWSSGKVLREAISRVATADKVSYFDLKQGNSQSVVGQSIGGRGMGLMTASSDANSSRREMRPTYVEFYARTANWDADTPRDGVKLQLTVRNANDQSLHAGGVLRAELWGSYQASSTSRRKWQRIAAWTRTVKAAQFANGVATLRLTYPSRNPELHPGYGGDAILHVAYNAQGAGVLEASQTMRLRPYDRLRDQLELQSGSRFLPAEHAR